MKKDRCNVCGDKYVLKDGKYVCKKCGNIKVIENENLESLDFIDPTNEEKNEIKIENNTGTNIIEETNDLEDDIFLNEEPLKELGIYYKENLDTNFEQKIKVAYSLLTSELFKDAQNVFETLLVTSQNPRIKFGKFLAINNLKTVHDFIESSDLLLSNFDLLIELIDSSSKEDASKYLTYLINKIISNIKEFKFEESYNIYSKICNYDIDCVQSKHCEIARKALESFDYSSYFYKLFELSLTYIIKNKEEYLNLMFDAIITLIQFEEKEEKYILQIRKYYNSVLKISPNDFNLKLLEFCILSKTSNLLKAIGKYLNTENIEFKLKEKIESFKNKDKNAFLNILSNSIQICFYDEEYIKDFKPLEDSIKFILTYEFDEKEELINYLLNEFYNNPSKSNDSLFELIISLKYSKDPKELINSYIKYSNAFLRFEVFDNAEKYAKKALSLDSNNHEALTILFLTSLKATSIKDISKHIVNLDNFEGFEKIYESFDDENKKTGFIYNMCNSCIEYLNEPSNHEQEFNKHVFDVFDYIIKYYPKDSTKELLESLNVFADSSLKYSFFEESKKYYLMMLEVDQNNYNAYWGLLKVRLNVKNDEEIIHQKILIGELPEYINALLSTANDKEAYNKIIKVKEEQELYLTNLQIEEKNQIEHVKKKKKIRKILIFTSIVLALVALIASITSALTINVFIPTNIYNDSLSLINEGKYEEASEKLDTISKDGFKDRETQKKICEAGIAFNKGLYETGIKTFTEAGGKVNVSYDANGGSANKNSETFSNETKNYFINDLNINSHIDTDINTNDNVNKFINNDPSKEGYAFKEWVIKDFNIKTAFEDYKCDLTLKANYTTITYNISYDLDGGNSNNLVSEYNIESDTFKLGEPTKSGYTFIGWSGTNIDGIQKDVTISTGSIGDRHYKANYEANKYKVTLDWNDDIHVEEVSVTYDSKYTLKTPTKLGYTFKYWTFKGTKFNQEGIWKFATNITLEAVYDVVDYNITYELNGGKCENPTSYTIETSTFTLNEPSKTGYTFTGWTGTDLKEITKEVSISKGSTGDRNYTANYKANQYKIILDYGDDKTLVTKYVTYDSSYTLDTPTKPGYIFKYWEYLNYKVELSGIWKLERNNITLKAVYGPQEYSISYNLNNGKEDTNPTSYTTETPSFILNNPSKTGYTFTGWTGTDLKAVTKAVTISKGSTGNRSYTANYQANQYTVKFDYGDGATIKSSKYTYDSKYTLITPSRNGYTFKYWTYNNSKIDQTGIWEIPNDVTLVAKYDTKDYSISYDLNSGYLSYGSSNYSSYNIDTPTFTLKEPSKTGYNFVGWTGTDVSSPTKNLEIKKGSYGDRYYKANYETYVYLYEIDELFSDRVIFVRYNESYSLSTPTKSGYKFVRWYYYSGSTKVTMPSSGTWLYEGKLNVYSEWEKEPTKYTISYNLNGGSFASGTNPAYYYTEDTNAFTLPAPTKLGYTFTGWTGSYLSSATKTVTIPKGSSGNRTYYANYTANEYKVTLVFNDGTTYTFYITYGASYTIKKPDTFYSWKTTDGTWVNYTGIWNIPRDVTLTMDLHIGD